MADDEKKLPTTPRASVKRPSPRELEVLKLLVCGKRNQEVAAEFGISEKTIEAHRANLCRKFGVRGLVGLMVAAVVRGFVPMPKITDDGVIQHGEGNGPRESALLEAARAVCLPCGQGNKVKRVGKHWRHSADLPCGAGPIWSLIEPSVQAQRAKVAR